MADRYTYLPSIGIFIIIVWGISKLFAKLRYKKIILSIVSGITLVIVLFCTRLQVGYWRNGFTLYSRAIEVTGNNYFMHNLCGEELLKQERTNEALLEFDKALSIYPFYSYSIYRY